MPLIPHCTVPSHPVVPPIPQYTVPSHPAVPPTPQCVTAPNETDAFVRFRLDSAANSEHISTLAQAGRLFHAFHVSRRWVAHLASFLIPYSLGHRASHKATRCLPFRDLHQIYFICGSSYFLPPSYQAQGPFHPPPTAPPRPFSISSIRLGLSFFSPNSRVQLQP